MELAIRFTARLLGAALTVAAFGIGHSASAETILFDIPHMTPLASYTEQGYEFGGSSVMFPSLPLTSPGNGGFFSDDPSPTSTTLQNTEPDTVMILTKVGGGAFDLTSMDFSNDFTQNIPIDMTFNFLGGGSSTTSFTIPGFTFKPVLQTFAINQSNLLSVAWHTEGFVYFQVDNVVVNAASVAATPIPGALPLFASALSLLGFGAWRRRGANAAG